MIVCSGEALIDFLPREGTDGTAVFQPFPGGSVFNVAIALGRLGEPTGFLSGLSQDFFGTSLVETLRASHVDTSLSIFSERPTTLAFVTLTDGQAQYAFFDEGSAGRMLAADDLPAVPKEVEAMHFGSISLMAEPGGSTYETLMRNESPFRVICLDPNVRPSLIKNRDGYLARIDRMVEMTDIIKCSDDDLEWLAPDRSFETIASDWLDRGVKLAILTRGAEGATAITTSGSASVAGVAVDVADTIGAGDTFSAAILSWLRTNRLLTKSGVADLSEAELGSLLSFAAKAAAVTASRPGADPPWRWEME
ncbi:carbohydrate kinase family protein [Bauldia sp.]|uniref:carbohydrate kinase family protein n=1 Tax=Bauldia sp. TaxID=2575872 RepID=UPI003BAA5C35